MSTTSRVAGCFDAAALERVLAPFGQSRNLPQEAYTSEEVFAWELHSLYGKSWVCVGRADDLDHAGKLRGVQLGADGILLARGSDGVLRGFFNVCRHRGHELLEPGGRAQARVIRCGYHGWTYELDGALKVAPRFGDVPGFEASDHALAPARIEEWGGWVFANPSGEAAPLAEWLGELDELVRDYEPERARTGAELSYEVAANWKLVHENYHECYHCPQIHPQLCKVSPPDSGRNLKYKGLFVGGPMDLMEHAVTMSLDGRSQGVFMRRLPAAKQRQLYYYGLLPNLFISLHPDYILTHRLEPLAHNRTRIECQWLFPPEAFEKEGFSAQYAVDFWDMTNRQDWKALESMQRGISSRGYRPGPLSQREGGIYQFVTQMARAYLEGGFAAAGEAPAATPS
ncbi:MAG: aromatic ring-hydroxylating oxygenase subunit alpha [Candidatus Acidiferrales bacterium]